MGFRDKFSLRCVFLYLFLCVALLTGCGGGGGNGTNPTPGTPPTTNEIELIFAEVIGKDNPIIALATDKNGSEAIGVLGERDPAGNPIKVTGAIYISGTGDAGILEAGQDGLPVSLTDSSGNKAIFSNYTNSSVDISFFDINQNLIAGPITISVELEELAQIKDLFSAISFGNTNLKGFSTFELGKFLISEPEKIGLKFASQAMQFALCGGSLAATIVLAPTIAGAVPMAILAATSCSSLLIATISDMTENQFDDQLSIAVSTVSCVAGSLGDCASALFDFIVAIDSIIDSIIADTTPPSIPTNLIATTLSSTQINLTWTASNDNVGVVGYKIFRNGSLITDQVITTDYIDSGLSPSTPYCYTVSAYDAANNESVQSSQACTITLVSGTIPLPPIDVSATPGNGQITLSWMAVSGATSYNIYMASVSGVAKSSYSTLPDGIKHTGVVSPYTIAPLTNGKTYYFVVTAVNAYGESAESTEVSEVAGGLIYASSGEGTGSGPSSLYKIVPTIDGNDMLVGLITTPDGLNPVITDLALTPTGILYGVSFDTLYIIDKTTAIATPVGSGLGFTDVNALASDSKGNLFAAGFVEPSFLLGVSISTGLATTIGPYGSGFISSGDLAVSPNDILYAAVQDTNITNTVLVTVDQNSGTASRINSTFESGFTNIWGLSFVGGQLYGLTSDINGIGILLLIDINTGQGSFVRNINFSAFGSSKPRK